MTAPTIDLLGALGLSHGAQREREREAPRG